jgi:choline monooxygenase
MNKILNRSSFDSTADSGLMGFNDDASLSTTLPADWYFKPEVFALEKERIFYRTWSYQCHVSDVPNPGDYHVGEVLDQGVVILRADDGQLRAFYNVCSHRAHPLLTGSGNTRVIVCPYHQWCYERNGKFRAARGLEHVKGMAKSDADLKPVRIEIFGGFVFVNLDENAVPLQDQAGSLLQDMRDACPGYDDLVRVHRYEVDLAANWKTVVDNNNECYHCNVNHKSLLELVDYKATAKWKESGITTCHTVTRGDDRNAAYSLDAVEQNAMFGYVWPTTIPLMFPGTSSLVLFHVIPTGPETTRERWDFYFTSKQISAQEQGLIDYCTKALTTEDIGLCEAVQKGLHSRGYSKGRFVANRDHVDISEHHVHRFQTFVRDAMMNDRE